MIKLTQTVFPYPDQGFVRAKRTPVLYQPLLGSPEQFVVGAIAFDGSKSHMERANRLNRLECFYGSQAAGAILAIEISLDELAADLAVDPSLSDSEYQTPTSGIMLGATQDVEGPSLAAIARSWLAGMSSLYAAPQESANLAVAYTELDLLDDGVASERASDRLGGMLLRYVTARNPKLKTAFSRDILTNAQRRRGHAHGVHIDFSGSKLVANFAVLSPNGYTASIDRIKRRMWDLKVFRDDERGGLLQREHEMLVQHPPANDPQLNQRQVDKIFDSVRELERQADQEEIRFRPMLSVAQIGDHLLQKEAA
ncbi:hypothetical protein [Sinorhizobium meliloti]|uniref:hypothetical protein n=1 Tax=Rhizobium meliloti TaxID=382 RepID=UPI000FD9DFA2|nr:hypothetical protein [Sinorhizobium meliloti]RVO57771.1 hypothetical protein CN092_11920 [Sinorhizobium meliloti]